MARVRDGSNTLMVVMDAQDKQRLREIVSHIPHETMLSFVVRAIRREMKRYEEDPDAYCQSRTVDV